MYCQALLLTLDNVILRRLGGGVGKNSTNNESVTSQVKEEALLTRGYGRCCAVPHFGQNASLASVINISFTVKGRQGIGHEDQSVEHMM